MYFKNKHHQTFFVFVWRAGCILSAHDEKDSYRWGSLYISSCLKQSAPSRLRLHTLMIFTACFSHEDVCACVLRLRAPYSVRWMEEEEEEEVGRTCAVIVGRIEQQGASSAAKAVN